MRSSTYSSTTCLGSLIWLGQTRRFYATFCTLRLSKICLSGLIVTIFKTILKPTRNSPSCYQCPMNLWCYIYHAPGPSRPKCRINQRDRGPRVSRSGIDEYTGCPLYRALHCFLSRRFCPLLKTRQNRLHCASIADHA